MCIKEAAIFHTTPPGGQRVNLGWASLALQHMLSVSSQP